MESIINQRTMIKTDAPTTRQFEVLATFATALLMVLIAYIAVVLMWPHRTIDANTPFKIYTPIVEQGGTLVYGSDYEVYTDRPFEVEWQLVSESNPTLYFIMPYRGIFHPGKGRHTYRRTIPIPSDTQPGKYWLRIRDSVSFHQIRKPDVATFMTEQFQVVAKSHNH